MSPFQRLDSTAGESSDHILPSAPNDNPEPFFSNPGEYHDKFIDINPETKTLTIKNYYLVKKIRHLHVLNILYITPASKLHRIGVKGHGFSFTNIFWAVDWSRCMPGSNSIGRSFVIKVKGDRFRVGFSVEHREKFLEVLEYLHPGVTTRPDSYKDMTGAQLQSEGGSIESE